MDDAAAPLPALSQSPPPALLRPLHSCSLRPHYACCSITQAVINYEGGPNKSRFSWDPLTTLVAVRGAAAVSTEECSNCNGINVVR